jgi:putative N6-adenine-specific DNA methylase
MSQRFFAQTLPGFEEVLKAEVRRSGGKKLTVTKGGVEYDATHGVFLRTLMGLRSANRILMRIGEFRSRDREEFYRKMRRIVFERWLSPGVSLVISVTVKSSRLRHSEKVADLAFEAISSRFVDMSLVPPKREKRWADGAQRIFVRVVDNRCSVSLDGSGDLLHRRGWRQHSHPAPIRETIAAALLEIAQWDARLPLVDPMCGSGTFPIEAASCSRGLSAGRSRTFAAESWANIDPLLVAKMRATADLKADDSVPQIYGFDIDRKCVDMARAHSSHAGVSDAVHWECGDVRSLEPPCEPPGLVISNPPYGKRLKDENKAVRALLDRFAHRFDGWRLAVVVPSDRPPVHPELQLQERLRFRNGGLSVGFWVGQRK